MVQIFSKNLGDVKDKINKNLEVRYDLEERNEKYIKKELRLDLW